MEHTSIDSDVELYKYHSGAPSAESYTEASQELIDDANVQLATLGLDGLELESVERPVGSLPENPERLVAAYSDALIKQAEKNPNICLLYTSPSPRDGLLSRMPSSA